MINKVVYSEEALSHLDRLSDFLVRGVGVSAAAAVVDELLDGFDILKKMPHIGREHPDPLLADRGYRVLILGQYAGVYLVLEETVWIAGVYHTKMDWLAKNI